MKELKEKLLKLMGKEKSISKLCEKLELEEYELLGIIELLKREGHNLDIYSKDGEYRINVLTKIILPEENEYCVETNLKKIKIGIVSDTHLCSKYQQLTLLNEAYKDFHSRGINTVLHIGDLTDGDYKNRPDHIYSLFRIGASDQAEYVCEMYPKIKGMKTYFIQGSHDATHIKNGGADLGKMVSQARKDMVNLGMDTATFKLNNCKIKMLHPGDGTAYAYSYKPQKIIDSMRGGEKPHVLLIGHYHKNLYMMYRNIHVLMIPSLQATTPFMTRKALINDVGYNVIEFEINKKGEVQKFNVEYIPFYKTIQDDYKKCKALKL